MSEQSPTPSKSHSKTPEGVERQGRAAARGITNPFGWPRLLSVSQASAYLGLSEEIVSGLLADGTIPTVVVPRPHTARELRRGALGENVRRKLIDRADLDAFVDGLKSAPGAANG